MDRGLDSLFFDNSIDEIARSDSESEKNDDGENGISTVRISLIEPDKNQPRSEFDEDALNELAENIRQHGVLQPILVRPLDNGGYKIVAGERRWRAARLAGLDEVPVYIKELTDLEAAEISLIENIQRKDLTPLEEAAAYQTLMETYGLTQQQVAEAVGRSRSAVANSIRLLSLSENVQEMLRDKKLTEGHAKVLAGVADKDTQEKLATECIENGWTVRELEKAIAAFETNKKAEKKEEVKQEVKVVVPQKQNTTTVYAAPGSTVVVKDVKGKVRDVDEYNRRYTSRDNNFSMENDTLYIEEKPLNERGEWVNGFEGSQDDYEYAMRIVRFRNPRYAIPVSSPLYWDVVYGLPSWDWNVYDDGLYAYVFPTYTNRLWWDWRWNYPYGASWGFSWGWSSPWYYNSWYYPGYWGGGYWGGYWGYHHHHHHHYYPHYSGHGWGGGYWGGGHGWYGSSRRNPGIHAGRYTNSYGSSRPSRNNYVNSYDRNSRNSYVGNSRQNVRNSANSYRTATRNGSSSGRVVSGSDGVNSVRPNRSAIRTRTGATLSPSQAAGVRPGNSYSRPTEGRGSSYTRPSSTRRSVGNAAGSAYQRTGAASRGAYRNNSGVSNSRSSSYSRSSSPSRNSSSNSYRSSGTSSSRSSFSSGGGASRSSGGGVSRSSGGGRSRTR